MEWISVDERMPNINVIPGVLTCTKYGHMDVQPVYNDGNGNPIFCAGWNKGDSFEVTHWMPLPAPPTT